MRDVAIAGIGYSDIGRESKRSVGGLTIDACSAALADAGIAPADVDGLATYPGGGDSVAGFYVADAFGMRALTWYEDIAGWAPAAIAPLISAADAVARGACEIALVFRSVKRNRERPPGMGFTARVGGDQQFRAPFGDPLTSQWLAMWARRHMHEFGTTEAHLGHIAVTFRQHAAHNPRAPLRAQLTIEDYFASRIVTTPFRLLDCDFPVDGAGAVVITTVDRARDLPRAPVVIKGGEVGTGSRPDWEQWLDLTTMASKPVMDRLWSRTGLRASDVNVAQLYDGFSWLALCWLEDAGFCPKGEGGPFIADGNIALGGTIPVNTHGGSLSGGRLHGISHIIEGVEQIRGTAAGRQVPNAEVALITAGGGTLAGAAVLTADR